MLEKDWSKRDTIEAIAKVREYVIPDKWQAIFLPLPEVIAYFFKTREFAAITVKALIDEAEKFEQRIQTYSVDHETFVKEFHKWLRDGTGGYSWDVRKIIQYGKEMQAKIEIAEHADSEKWLKGDWRDHVGALVDDSVALVLTDPPYGIDYQSDYQLDRSKNRKHGKIENDKGNAPEDSVKMKGDKP